jgi:hypothetical protein
MFVFHMFITYITKLQVTDEVNKALAAGLSVELDYSPGNVKLNIKQAEGGVTTLSCQWA